MLVYYIGPISVLVPARDRDRFCDGKNLRDQLCFGGIRAYRAISSHLIKTLYTNG